ncbi:MAG: TRAP transporter large permease subunit [Bradymonadia bacterium]
MTGAPDREPSSHSHGSSNLLRLCLSSLPILALLLGVLVYKTASDVQARLQDVGESIWPGYALIPLDPQAPACDPASFVIPTAPVTPKAEEGDDDLLDDLLEEDDEDDLFDDEEDEAISPEAVKAAKAKCEAQHAAYQAQLAKITDGLKTYKGVEGFFEGVVKWGTEQLPLSLLLLLVVCGATATAVRGHIALRAPATRLDDRVSEGGQLLANVLLLWSCYARMVLEGDGPARGAYIILIAGFGMLAALNTWHLIRPAEYLKPGGNLLKGLLSVPLYATMAIISGVWFFAIEDYPSGLANYLTKLMASAQLYLYVGFYVWIGMLLKQTRLASLVFSILRPWRLPPEILAFVVVVGSALPTAYSGASGIFVIAAGALIFDELRKSGASRSVALAATAMSGSLGVVLRPCLLVVIVASLNSQVTTDQLYMWGFRVFGLTALMFLVVTLISRRNPISIAPPAQAAPESMRRLLPLVPYALFGVAVLAIYAVGLNTKLNETSLPYVLPVVLLCLLAYDRFAGKRRPLAEAPSHEGGFTRGLLGATTETTAHIGALLLLMGLSVCLGGIIERAEIMEAFPTDLGGPMITMALMVGLLVLIGMVMDPYGAVILVSASIATVAYRNGIEPVHFWMVVLLAFELGYLTPPVALNHLLARQVVREIEGPDAEAEEIEALAGASFFRRHERVLVPIIVVGTSLVLVAFGPLIVGY